MCVLWKSFSPEFKGIKAEVCNYLFVIMIRVFGNCILMIDLKIIKLPVKLLNKVIQKIPIAYQQTDDRMVPEIIRIFLDQC